MRTIKIIQPVLIVLVVHIIFTAFILQYYQGDLSCLVHAGPTYTNPAEAPANLCQKDVGDGYDGQFSYRFALDPFSTQPAAHGITVDRPAYRYQRIFYSLLAWALTAGSSALVPAVLVLINLASICGLTALGAVYALDQGRNSHWSLALGLYLGFLISYALDLPHALQILLMFAAMFLLRRRDGWAAVLLACAILTRETAVLFAGAVLVAAFIQRWRRWYVYLLPIGVFFAWQIFTRWFWRAATNLTSGEGMVFPLLGLIQAFGEMWQRGDIFGIGFLALTLGFGLAVLFALRRSTAPLYIKLAWLLYSGLALVMSVNVWTKFNGYLRILSEWFFVSCLVLFPVIRLPGWLAALRLPRKPARPRAEASG